MTRVMILIVCVVAALVMAWEQQPAFLHAQTNVTRTVVARNVQSGPRRFAEVNSTPLSDQQRAAADFLLRRSTQPLQKLSDGTPWQPRRNFGPFYAGSHFPTIKIRMNGTAAEWYFTTYLQDHAGQTLIPNYYVATGGSILEALPPDIPSVGATPRHVPGAFPSTDGLHDLQFSLTRVSYSGQFGGSIQLSFSADETFEFDARRGSILWDFADAELLINVVPNYLEFNRTATGTRGVEPIYVRLRPIGATAYSLTTAATGVGTNPRTVVTLDPQSRDAELNQLSSSIETAIQSSRSRFRASAAAFVYGYIHELFRDRLGTADVVSMMELTDGFFDIQTRAGTPEIYIRARIANVKLDTDIGDEELRATVLAGSLNGDFSGGAEFDLEGRTSTAFRPILVIPLSACTGSGDLVFDFWFTEEEVTGEEQFRANTFRYALNCALLQSAANAGDWQSRFIDAFDERVITEGEDTVGAFSLEVMVSVNNR